MHDYRPHTCGALRPDDVGRTVRLSGWVHRKRDHGNLMFIDLRDHYGVTQVVLDVSSPIFPVATLPGVDGVPAPLAGESGLDLGGRAETQMDRVCPDVGSGHRTLFPRQSYFGRGVSNTSTFAPTPALPWPGHAATGSRQVARSMLSSSGGPVARNLLPIGKIVPIFNFV